MTTWTEAAEAPEYVLADYMAIDYVLIAWVIGDGLAGTWVNATEDAPSWTEQ